MANWQGAQQGRQSGPGAPATPRDGRSPESSLTDGGPPVRHRPWSTVLLVVHVVGLVVGVGAVVGGVAIAVAAGTQTPDPTDGIYEPWGLVIGGVLAVLGVVALLAAGALTALTAWGRRAADTGRPGPLRGLAIAVVVLAGLGWAGSLAAGDLLSLMVWSVLGGLYALLGFLVLRATGSDHRSGPRQGSA